MNPKIEETLKALEYEAFMLRGNDVSAVCLAAADLITKLQQELIDERYRHDRYADFCVAQGEELSKLKEQQRWIPVTEKLPSDPDTFVLCIASGRMNNIELVGAYQLATYNDEDGWVLELFPAWIGVHVTHWMPLPERPEEDE